MFLKISFKIDNVILDPDQVRIQIGPKFRIQIQCIWIHDSTTLIFT